ncbi:MAG TPA: dTDP-4-dehydrorhamnose 3,5-epimerase [Ignavibacteria bacterium]|jgi:dTDP-4-dehydrorhamnose 3,5-epimerase
MEIQKTRIKDILLLTPKVFSDNRGFFFESFRENIFSEIGIDYSFVQENISKSIKGSIRGLHYQVGEFAQGKLCQVLKGNVLDVAVDIRFGSPTFGKYVSVELSDENHNILWMPPGFAHGFSVLSDDAIFHYRCTEYYSKEHERAIFYADEDLAINWKVSYPIVSPKDLEATRFKDIEKDFEYTHPDLSL